MALDVDVVFQVDTSRLNEAQQQLQAIQDKNITVKVETDANSVSDLKTRFDQVVRSVDPASAAVQDFGKKLKDLRSYGALVDPNDAAQLAALTAAEKLLNDQLNARIAAVEKLNARQSADPALVNIDKLVAKYNPLQTAINRTTAEVEKLRAAQAKGIDVGPSLKNAEESLKSQTEAMGKLAAGTKLTFQEQEIFRSGVINIGQSLLAGISPMRVLETQGAQLAGAFTSVERTRELFSVGLGKLADIAKAAGAFLLTPVGALVAVGAAFATLVAAGVIVSRQMSAVQDSLKLVGESAGVSAANVLTMSNTLSSTTRDSGSEIRTLAAAYIGMGVTGIDTLTTMTHLTQEYQRATGATADAAQKAVVAIYKSPSTEAKNLHDSIDLLTTAQLLHIESLERSGQAAAAATEVMKAYQERLKTAADNMGYLGQAATYVWDKTKLAVSTVIDVFAAGVSVITDFGKKQVSAAEAAAAAQKKQQDVAISAARTTAQSFVGSLQQQLDAADEAKKQWAGYAAIQEQMKKATLDSLPAMQAQADLFKANAEKADSLVKSLSAVQIATEHQKVEFIKNSPVGSTDLGDVTDPLRQPDTSLANRQTIYQKNQNQIARELNLRNLTLGETPQSVNQYYDNQNILIDRATAQARDDLSRATKAQTEYENALTEAVTKGAGAMALAQARNQALEEQRTDSNKVAPGPAALQRRVDELMGTATAGLKRQADSTTATLDRQTTYQNNLTGAIGKGVAATMAQEAANKAAEDAFNQNLTPLQQSARAHQYLAQATAELQQAQAATNREFDLSVEMQSRLLTAYGQSNAAVALQAAQNQAALDVESKKITADQQQIRVLQLLRTETDNLSISSAKYLRELDVQVAASARSRAASAGGAPATRTTDVRIAAEQKFQPDIDAAKAQLEDAQKLGNTAQAADALNKIRQAGVNIERAYQGELAKSTDSAIKNINSANVGVQQSIDLTQKEMETWNLSFDERTRQLDDLKTKQQLFNAGLKETDDGYAEMYGKISALKDIQRQQADESRSMLGGLRSSWQAISDDATNYGKQAGDALKSAFDGATDSLADFLTTGKNTFADFLASLSKQLVSSGLKTGIAELFNSLSGSGDKEGGGGVLGSLLSSVGLGSKSGGAASGISGAAKALTGGSSTSTMNVTATTVNVNGGGKAGDAKGLTGLFGGEDNSGEKMYDSAIGPTMGDGDPTGKLLKENDGFFSGLTDKFDSLTSSIGDEFSSAASDVGDVFSGVAKGVGDGFSSIVGGLGDSLSSAFTSIMSLFGGSGGGGDAGSYIGAAVQAYSAYAAAANGMVMQGGVKAYATGGYAPGMYDKPTFSPMADGRTAEIGEAGPEAVIPLARGPDGKLGIAGGGTGSTGNITVNNSVTINNPKGDGQDISAEVMKQMNNMITNKITAQIKDAQRSGGQLNPLPMRGM